MARASKELGAAESRRNGLDVLVGARRAAIPPAGHYLFGVREGKTCFLLRGAWKNSLRQWQRGFMELMQRVHFQGCSRRVWEDWIGWEITECTGKYGDELKKNLSSSSANSTT